MQLGSGTFDLMPGITYGGHSERFGWGSVAWLPWISTSLRLVGHVAGDVDGQDRSIVGPVQTADPDHHGGERIDVLFGVNLAGPTGWTRGHRT